MRARILAAASGDHSPEQLAIIQQMIKRSEAIVSFLGLYCKAQPHASFVSNYTVHTAHPLDHSEAVPLFIVRKSLTQHAMPRAQMPDALPHHSRYSRVHIGVIVSFGVPTCVHAMIPLFGLITKHVKTVSVCGVM